MAKKKKATKKKGTKGKSKPLGWIDETTKIGTVFEFVGKKGDYDPRIEGPAPAAFHFIRTLLRASFDQGDGAVEVRLMNEEDGSWLLETLDHWNTIYAPAVTGTNEQAKKGR